MPITAHTSGSYDRTIQLIEDGRDVAKLIDLNKYGEEGVSALKMATPSKTGKTATSWYYTIESKRNTVSINFNNSYMENGMHVAIIIDKGHATKKGNWVAGKNYINDAMDPVYNKLVEEIKRKGLSK